MDTCILSGPTEANEAATDTFTLVGKHLLPLLHCRKRQCVFPVAALPCKPMCLSKHQVLFH